MIYFTSDLHFNHRNIIDFCQRPFADVQEMNAAIIDGINRRVTQKDELYVLGDFGLHVRDEDIPNFLKRIYCRNVRLIFGNHDHHRHGNFFQHSYDMLKVNWNRQSFLLCHYPLRSWRASYQLHGHEHGNMKPLTGQLDIGVDGVGETDTGKKGWRGTPWSVEEVIEYVQQRDRDRLVKDPCREQHQDNLIVGGYDKDGRQRFARDGRDAG